MSLLAIVNSLPLLRCNSDRPSPKAPSNTPSPRSSNTPNMMPDFTLDSNGPFVSTWNAAKTTLRESTALQILIASALTPPNIVVPVKFGHLNVVTAKENLVKGYRHVCGKGHLEWNELSRQATSYPCVVCSSCTWEQDVGPNYFTPHEWRVFLNTAAIVW